MSTDRGSRPTTPVARSVGDTSTTSIEYESDGGGGGTPAPNPYAGGRYTLPVGDYTNEWKVDRAWALDGVILLLAEFVNRGYVREGSDDIVISTDSTTSVYIMYSIPGVPKTERQPYIMARTAPVYGFDYYYNAWMMHYGTQVWAGCIVDSSGTAVIVPDGPDAPVGIQIAPETSGALLDWPTCNCGFDATSMDLFRQFEENVQRPWQNLEKSVNTQENRCRFFALMQEVTLTIASSLAVTAAASSAEGVAAAAGIGIAGQKIAGFGAGVAASMATTRIQPRLTTPCPW